VRRYSAAFFLLFPSFFATARVARFWVTASQTTTKKRKKESGGIAPHSKGYFLSFSFFLSGNLCDIFARLNKKKKKKAAE